MIRLTTDEHRQQAWELARKHRGWHRGNGSHTRMPGDEREQLFAHYKGFLGEVVGCEVLGTPFLSAQPNGRNSADSFIDLGAFRYEIDFKTSDHSPYTRRGQTEPWKAGAMLRVPCDELIMDRIYVACYYDVRRDTIEVHCWDWGSFIDVKRKFVTMNYVRLYRDCRPIEELLPDARTRVARPNLVAGKAIGTGPATADFKS